MGYVQKYDVKVKDRTQVRVAIEEHLEDLFTTLECQAFLSDIHTFHDNVKYAYDIISFLANIGILGKKEKEKYGKLLIEIQKERIYAV